MSYTTFGTWGRGMKVTRNYCFLTYLGLVLIIIKQYSDSMCFQSIFSWKLRIIPQILDECHCWWTSESPRAHVAKFYGRHRLIRSFLRASKFSALKLIEIVILFVYYTIPFGFSLFRHFRAIIFNF